MAEQKSTTDLVNMLEGFTKIQSKEIASKYLGNSIRVSGAVYEIDDRRVLSRFFTFKTVYSVCISSSIDNRLVFLSFSEKWENRINILRKGDKISVIGKISDISSNGVSLRDCRII